MDPNWQNFCPNVQPLLDALFETDDDGESLLLRDLVLHFENFSSWPRDFYKSRDAIHWLSEYSLIARGQAVQEYNEVMESRRQQAESVKKYCHDQPAPSSPAPHQQPNQVEEVVHVKIEPQQVDVVDLVSDDVLASVGAEVGGDEVVMEGLGTLVKGSKKKKGCDSRKRKKGKDKWVPSVIVCAVTAPGVEPVVNSKGKGVVKDEKKNKGKGKEVLVDDKNRKGKGKEVLVDDKNRKGKGKVVDDGGRRRSRRLGGQDRLNLGGNERRSKHGVPLDEPKLVEHYEGHTLHDLLIEDDDKGWQKFKVVEHYDSGLDSGEPEVPWSPPSCSEELDPDSHVFLLMKKEPASP